MSISFKGLGENVITFKTTNAVAGEPVTISANERVTKSTSGETFCGVAVSVSEDYAAVQISGFVELPYSGTAPTVGYNTFVANGNGGVRTNTTGRTLLVVNVNSSTSKVVAML